MVGARSCSRINRARSNRTPGQCQYVPLTGTPGEDSHDNRPHQRRQSRSRNRGGWFEREHLANAIDYGRGFGDRLDRMDEAVRLIRSLFLGKRVTSDGPHYPVQDLRHEPRPVRGDIPILVGGRGKSKTLRTVARYAQIWNAYGTPEELVQYDAILRTHCGEVGREHTEIERSVQAKVIIRDTAEAAEAAFVNLLTMNKTAWAGKGRGAEPDMLDRYVFPDPDSAIWLGSPREIAERIKGYLEIGFGTVIAEIPAPYDRETIERLIGEVAPMVRDPAFCSRPKEWG